MTAIAASPRPLRAYRQAELDALGHRLRDNASLALRSFGLSVELNCRNWDAGGVHQWTGKSGSLEVAAKWRSGSSCWIECLGHDLPSRFAALMFGQAIDCRESRSIAYSSAIQLLSRISTSIFGDEPWQTHQHHLEVKPPKCWDGTVLVEVELGFRHRKEICQFLVSRGALEVLAPGALQFHPRRKSQSHAKLIAIDAAGFPSAFRFNAHLPSTYIALNDLLELRAGSVLPLPLSIGSAFEVSSILANHPVAYAHIGRKGQKKALELIKPNAPRYT